MTAEEKKGKEEKQYNVVVTHIVASRPPKCRSKIQNTRLGLQCQTPRRSYPLSLIPFPLSLIPYPLYLVPYPLVLFLSRNLGCHSHSCDSCDCPQQN